MTGFAVALVLASAVFHATWNLLAKRAGGGAAFLWLSDTMSVVLLAPLVVALFVIERPALGWVELIFIAGSAALHLVYFLLLLRGYRLGDLSVVYPLARGTGPALSTLAAIIFLGERPTPLAIIGAALVVIGVFVVTGGHRVFAGANASKGAVYGLLTGVFIAAYTLWDKQAVSAAMIPPVLLYYGATLGRILMLAPVVVNRWDEVTTHWRSHRLEALGVGVLGPASYILVLTALVFTPVSYVAPAREISILIGVALGARLLAEGDSVRRLAAACTMVLGVVALSVG